MKDATPHHHVAPFKLPRVRLQIDNLLSQLNAEFVLRRPDQDSTWFAERACSFADHLLRQVTNREDLVEHPVLHTELLAAANRFVHAEWQKVTMDTQALCFALIYLRAAAEEVYAQEESEHPDSDLAWNMVCIATSAATVARCIDRGEERVLDELISTHYSTYARERGAKAHVETNLLKAEVLEYLLSCPDGPWPTKKAAAEAAADKFQSRKDFKDWERTASGWIDELGDEAGKFIANFKKQALKKKSAKKKSAKKKK